MWYGYFDGCSKCEFDTSNLEKITENYAADLLHNVCTCPAFTYREGDCKHLVALKKLKRNEGLVNGT